jgi:hypothetical protein
MVWMKSDMDIIWWGCILVGTQHGRDGWWPRISSLMMKMLPSLTALGLSLGREPGGTYRAHRGVASTVWVSISKCDLLFGKSVYCKLRLGPR